MNTNLVHSWTPLTRRKLTFGLDNITLIEPIEDRLQLVWDQQQRYVHTHATTILFNLKTIKENHKNIDNNDESGEYSGTKMRWTPTVSKSSHNKRKKLLPWWTETPSIQK